MVGDDCKLQVPFVQKLRLCGVRLFAFERGGDGTVVPRHGPISAKVPNRVSVVFRRNLFISRLRASTYIDSRLVIQVCF